MRVGKTMKPWARFDVLSRRRFDIATVTIPRQSRGLSFCAPLKLVPRIRLARGFVPFYRRNELAARPAVLAHEAGLALPVNPRQIDRARP
jgi:hypothetical protein